MRWEARIIDQLSDIVRQHANLIYRIGDEHKWRALSTRALAAIERTAPAGSAYRHAVLQIQAMTEDGAAKGYADQLVGVVEALLDDYRGGYMRRVEELVHAGLFDDFLDMAQELLAKGYKDPAAVLVGSVLEEHLRKLAQRNTSTTTDEGKPLKAERMNEDLAKAGIYNALEQKSVTAWLDLRNKAAHGHYDQYDSGHVEPMIQGVRSFVSRHPA